MLYSEKKYSNLEGLNISFKSGIFKAIDDHYHQGKWLPREYLLDI